MRYFCDMTQTEVAKRLGISQVQVSRMEKRILHRLKKEIKLLNIKILYISDKMSCKKRKDR